MKKLAPTLLGITANLSLAILQFIISIIIAVALMLNTKTLSPNLVRFVSRLVPNKGQTLVKLASSTLRNVIRGVIGISAIQTLAIGIRHDYGRNSLGGYIDIIMLTLDNYPNWTWISRTSDLDLCLGKNEYYRGIALYNLDVTGKFNRYALKPILCHVDYLSP